MESARKTAEVLRKAAKIMRTGGLKRGKLWDERGAHCALGAIVVARNGTRASLPAKADPAAVALADVVREKLPPIPFADTYNDGREVSPKVSTVAVIAGWNNMMCESAEDVAKCMEGTAEVLEAEDEKAD